MSGWKNCRMPLTSYSIFMFMLDDLHVMSVQQAGRKRAEVMPMMPILLGPLVKAAGVSGASTFTFQHAYLESFTSSHTDTVFTFLSLSFLF